VRARVARASWETDRRSETSTGGRDVAVTSKDFFEEKIVGPEFRCYGCGRG
jgi:hypothetical protein